MAEVTIETGTHIKRYDFWNPATWAIPKLYWDAYSQEQRIHAICRQLGKVIAYADYVGVNVDDIAQRLQDIEEGKLDTYIVARIEAWFEENEPAIVEALEQLETYVGTLNDVLPVESFTPSNTVADNIANIVSQIGEGFGEGNTIADNIDVLKRAHVIADDDLKIRVVDILNGNDTTAHAVTSPTDTSAMYQSLQKAWDDAIFEGTDVRIWFNAPGQYDVATRIVSGCVVHLMANSHCEGTIEIYAHNNLYGSLFFYDAHVNLSGTSKSTIMLQADQQIEFEGSTFWTANSIVSCTYLYLIQGSMQAHNTVFMCNVVGRYIQSVMRSCTFANERSEDAFYAICSIVRFEVDPDTGEKCTFRQNTFGAGHSAIRMYTCMLYCSANTLTSENELQLAYDYFFNLNSCLALIANASWQQFSTYAQQGNNFAQLSILNERNQQEQGGYETGIQIEGGGYTDVNITYNMTFYQTPYVFTQLQIGSGIDPNLSEVSAYVMNRSTTGCTIRILNNGPSGKIVTVMWRAEI